MAGRFSRAYRLTAALVAVAMLLQQLVLVVPAVGAAPDAQQAAAAAAGAPNGPTIRLLVKFKSGTTTAQADSAIKGAGGTSQRSLNQIRTRVIEVPAAAEQGILAAYKASPVVERAAAEVTSFGTAGTPDDPAYAQQWALPQIGWDQAYGSVAIGGSAKIAVLDTGVDAAHPDLAGRMAAGQSYLAGGNANSDPNGHGTALAGIAAASVNNATGMAGVAYAGASVAPV